MTVLGIVGAAVFVALGPALIVFDAVMTRRERRKPPRRRVLGRVSVDPLYLRDQFDQIVKHAPRELKRPDPRLYTLYLVPPTEGNNRDAC